MKDQGLLEKQANRQTGILVMQCWLYFVSIISSDKKLQKKGLDG